MFYFLELLPFNIKITERLVEEHVRFVRNRFDSWKVLEHCIVLLEYTLALQVLLGNTPVVCSGTHQLFLQVVMAHVFEPGMRVDSSLCL